MSTKPRYEITAIELSDDEYTVEQTGRDGNFRPEYEARNAAGETLFTCTYQMYEEKDAFPFLDADGDEIFAVEAEDTWDVAADYVLRDSRNGKNLFLLDNDLSLFQDTWRIRDAHDESLLAEVTSRGALYTVGRKLLPFGKWIGHNFEIADSDGDHVGSIESGFAMFDEYEITFDDASSVPREPIVASAIVIDGIQAN
jgi:uncharacterized protein YxjI